MLAGANIIYGLGMLEMGMTISYSQLLMDAEMAEMMLFSMDGIVVNDETLSVDVIKEVGPRSDFLAHMNTFENMYIQSKPKLIDRLTRDRWNEAGHLDMESRALIAAKELLATWEPEPLSEEACARVRAVLNKGGEGNRQYCLLLLRVLGHTSVSATSPAISGVLDKRAPEDPSFFQSWLRAQ